MATGERNESQAGPEPRRAALEARPAYPYAADSIGLASVMQFRPERLDA